MTTLELLLLCMVVVMSLTIMYLVFHLDKSEKEIAQEYARHNNDSQKYHDIESLLTHALFLLIPQRHKNIKVNLLFTQTRILLGMRVIRNAESMEQLHNEYEKKQYEET